MSRLVSFDDALPEVAADFAAVLPGGAEPRLAILDGVPDASVSEQVPDAAEWMDPADDEQVLLLVGGAVTSLTARWSDVRDGTPQWLVAGGTVPLGDLTAALR